MILLKTASTLKPRSVRSVGKEEERQSRVFLVPNLYQMFLKSYV